MPSPRTVGNDGSRWPRRDGVRPVGEAVNDGLREARVGEDLGPLAEGEVGGEDQRAAFDLEDEFGGAVGQRTVAAIAR
jgi:hypothetical protein